MKNFSSVSTNAARIQDISLNPQKLAGMCAKLKCCLNYEVDDYLEASRKLPRRDVTLVTQDAEYHLFKTDILAGLCTYSTDKNLGANTETITAKRAMEIIAMNKQGEKPLSLLENDKAKTEKKPVDLLADADVSRFDKAKKKKKKKNKNNSNKQAATRKAQDGATQQVSGKQGSAKPNDNKHKDSKPNGGKQANAK